MAEIAFAHVRDAILRGELGPGDRLPQAEIAATLHISRVPLREALRRLEERGFVTITPHRGAIVTPLSATDIQQMYAIRELLESASAGLAARNIDGARLKRLHDVLRAARAALDAGDSVELASLNRRFHLIGHEASGNKHLTRLISELAEHCQRYRLMHSALDERAHIAMGEHEEILAAYERADPEAAAHWIRVNLANSGRALLAALDRGDATAPAREEPQT
jgi:DNA-binding GntR family transcriptional regulator